MGSSSTGKSHGLISRKPSQGKCQFESDLPDHFVLWQRARVRLIGAVLKTVEGKTSEGSNPSAVASIRCRVEQRLFASLIS